jgi:Xaa-Pro aminopeptidase
LSARIERVRLLLAERHLDGLIISYPANRRYLSGYPADDHAPNESAGIVLIGGAQAMLLVSANNAEWAASEAPDFAVAAWTRPWTTSVEDRIKDFGWQRVGFEDAAMTVATHRVLTDRLGNAVELVAVGDAVSRLRSVKDAEELRLLERALAITDEAFTTTAAALKPGMTERQIAWMVELAMHDAGADGPGFPTSVASGPHAARPHHGVTDRKIETGEPITIDLGASYRGYTGDLTRTIWLGEADAKLKAVYNVVFAAQAAALAGLRAGLEGKAGDALARGVIEAAGYGDNPPHGLGHGLGLQVHEGPSLGVNSADVLQPGEVVTVEPGIYLPGWGGVRIEDVVVITDDGSRVLTRAPKVVPARG